MAAPQLADIWTHSLHLDPAHAEFEGTLSPTILLQLDEHRTRQISLNLHWNAEGYVLDSEIGESDERDEDSFQWLYQSPPQRFQDLDNTLRQLSALTSDLLKAAENLNTKRE